MCHAMTVRLVSLSLSLIHCLTTVSAYGSLTWQDEMLGLLEPLCLCLCLRIFAAITYGLQTAVSRVPG